MRPKGLTVKDLIEALSKVEDQTMEVAVKDGFSSVWHDLYKMQMPEGFERRLREAQEKAQ